MTSSSRESRSAGIRRSPAYRPASRLITKWLYIPTRNRTSAFRAKQNAARRLSLSRESRDDGDARDATRSALSAARASACDDHSGLLQLSRPGHCCFHAKAIAGGRAGSRLAPIMREYGARRRHHEEKADGHDHHDRRHGDLLQGLGLGPADRLQPRLAAFGRRLGHPAAVLPPARLPRHRPRPARARTLDPDRRRSRHGPLRRRPGRGDRPSRSPGRRPRRPLHRWRRGRALHRPARREPRGEGGADQCGAAAHGADRRQPRRPAEERVRRPPGPAGRQPVRVLPGPAVGPLLRLQPARRRSPRKRSSRTGGARG